MALPILDGNQSATTLSTILSGGEHTPAHTVVSLGSTAISNITSAVSGSVVSISNFPATQTISGTVTANLSSSNLNSVTIGVRGTVTVGNSVTIGSLPAISGTVTANVVGTRTFVDANAVTVSGFLAVGGWDTINSQHAPIPLTDGGNGVRIGFDDVTGSPLQIVNHPSNPLSATVTVGNSVTIGSLPTLTPQLPRVTFIDGSGSVTTANTAITVFASSSTRSYLLVQVTTGSAFVNVGATATTLNGISLTAGQGYAWETTIPQGAVSLISTTTNSAYVAKQA